VVERSLTGRAVEAAVAVEVGVVVAASVVVEVVVHRRQSPPRSRGAAAA